MTNGPDEVLACLAEGRVFHAVPVRGPDGEIVPGAVARVTADAEGIHTEIELSGLCYPLPPGRLSFVTPAGGVVYVDAVQLDRVLAPEALTDRPPPAPCAVHARTGCRTCWSSR